MGSFVHTIELFGNGVRFLAETLLDSLNDASSVNPTVKQQERNMTEKNTNTHTIIVSTPLHHSCALSGK